MDSLHRKRNHRDYRFGSNAKEDLWSYAAAYHEAGKILVATFENPPGYSDHEGYPVFFLYRHSLELYLKAIFYSGVGLLVGHKLISNISLPETDANFVNSHKLTHFIPMIKALGGNRGWGLDDKSKIGISLNEAIRTIEEVEKKDQSSEAFRYPVDSNGDRTLNYSGFDAIHFGKNLDPVLELLECLEPNILDVSDNVATIFSEIQGELKNKLVSE